MVPLTLVQSFELGKLTLANTGLSTKFSGLTAEANQSDQVTIEKQPGKNIRGLKTKLAAPLSNNTAITHD